MNRQIRDSSLMRPLALLVALLAAAWAVPRAGLIAVLRGQGRVEAELSRAQARGYYENLTARGPDRPPAAADPALAPPADCKTFGDSGVVAAEPTYRRWRMLPHRRVEWNGTSVTTNGLGYRTPEVAIPKPPGTYRIVVIGSSNTMGHGVDDDESYPRLLEDWLNGPEAGVGRPVEVVNTAISGDSPSQQLLRMHDDLPRLQPDWVLNDASVLDFSLEAIHLQWALGAGVPIPFDYVAAAVRRSGVSAADDADEFYRKLLPEFEPLLGGAYDGWAREARRLGVPMTMVLLPRADIPAENPNVVRLIHDLCRRNDLPCIDLSRSFAGLTPAQFRVAPWELHPSVLGHRLIFEGVRSALIRRGGPPGLPLDRRHASAPGSALAAAP